MKKIVSVLLAGLMVMSLAACSSAAVEDSQSESSKASDSVQTAESSQAEESKALSGTVTTGGSTSVEKVIGRALVFVVFILVVGILFAQVACKNIQLMSVASFDKKVDAASVEKAATSGVSWAGDIVKFPSMVSSAYDAQSATATVVVMNDSPRTLPQLVSASQSQAFTLAMAMFENDEVNTVVYSVCSNTLAPVTDQSGAKAAPQDEAPEPLISFVWQRGVDGTYACTLQGYDPDTASLMAGEQE